MLAIGGADVDDTRSGTSPLIWAIRCAQERCAKVLLDAGAAVNSECCGTPPLIWAVKASQYKTVKTLIEAGAHVNTFDSEGYNALGTCWNSSHYGCVQHLLKANAKINTNHKMIAIFPCPE